MNEDVEREREADIDMLARLNEASDDEDDEDGEGDEEEAEDEENDENKMEEQSKSSPSPVATPAPVPVAWQPVMLESKFGLGYKPKTPAYRRGSFMDQVRLLDRGGFCRSPKGRTESYFSLRDVEHKVPAPSAVTGGAGVARRLFAQPKAASIVRVVSPSKRQSRVSSMSLPLAPQVLVIVPVPVPVRVPVFITHCLIFIGASYDHRWSRN